MKSGECKRAVPEIMECRSSAKEKKSKRVIVSRLSMMIVWVSLYRSWMWPEGAKRYWDYDQRSRERGSWSKSHLWNERHIHPFEEKLFFPLPSASNSSKCCFAIISFDNGFQIRFGISVFFFLWLQQWMSIWAVHIQRT